jgi:uncharacterized protein (DUF2267 family)
MNAALERDLIAELKSVGGLGETQARQAMVATLETLGESLPSVTARALADVLSPVLSNAVLRRESPGELTREAFFSRVAAREKVAVGFALEHAQMICAKLAELVDPALLSLLRERLPHGIGALLEPRAHAEDAPPFVHRAREVVPGTGGTLATGRPGSRHSLADAREPAPTTNEASETTKLSSVQGPRGGATLASGKGGSTRPLSEGES